MQAGVAWATTVVVAATATRAPLVRGSLLARATRDGEGSGDLAAAAMVKEPEDWEALAGLLVMTGTHLAHQPYLRLPPRPLAGEGGAADATRVLAV
jgi:hypothetical protein